MHVIILGYEEHLLASPTRLHAAEAHLGIQLSIESPDDLSVDIVGSQTKVMLHGEPLHCDVILPRGTTPVSPFLDTALTIATRAGITVINSPDTIRACEDKLRTAVLLADAGIPQLPTTGLLPGGHIHSLSWEGMVYTKPVWASRGRDITRHTSVTEANNALTAMRRESLQGPVVQHLVAQPAAVGTGSDYRVLVINGEPIAVIERRTIDDSPVSTGEGSSKRSIPVSSEPDLCALALTATKAVGAFYAGVDIIFHENVPCVLEVNASPGLNVTSRLAHLDLEEILLSSMQHLQ